jgi:hypothetical protein
MGSTLPNTYRMERVTEMLALELPEDDRPICVAVCPPNWHTPDEHYCPFRARWLRDDDIPLCGHHAFRRRVVIELPWGVEPKDYAALRGFQQARDAEKVAQAEAEAARVALEAVARKERRRERSHLKAVG